MINARRNRNTIKASGKGLLILMRVGKFTQAKARAVRAKNLPRIRVVIPSCIRMPDRHIKPEGVPGPDGNGIFHNRFVREGRVCKGKGKKEDRKDISHETGCNPSSGNAHLT